LVSAANDKSAAEKPGSTPAASLARETDRDRERLVDPVGGEPTGVVTVVDVS
jgi:hypothetical protein